MIRQNKNENESEYANKQQNKQVNRTTHAHEKQRKKNPSNLRGNYNDEYVMLWVRKYDTNAILLCIMNSQQRVLCMNWWMKTEKNEWKILWFMPMRYNRYHGWKVCGTHSDSQTSSKMSIWTKMRLLQTKCESTTRTRSTYKRKTDEFHSSIQ